MQRGQICNASIGHRGMARPWPEPRWTGEGGPEPAQNCTAAQRQARMRRHTRVRVATVTTRTLPPPLAWPRTRHRARPPTLKRCPSQRLANHDLSAGDLPAGARYYAACGWHSVNRTHTHTHTRPPPPPPPHTPPPSPTRHPAPPYRPTARTPSVPAPPYGATSPRQSHRLRRPSTTAVFPRASSPRSTMGAPHHGCTPPTPFPALHAARPLSQWAHADRSRDRPCPHPPLLCPPCVRRLSLLRGDSHYMGTQSGASPRPFVVSVVHTMNTMAGAMQFSRG